MDIDVIIAEADPGGPTPGAGCRVPGAGPR
jgi:hypothetical protein